MTLLLVTGILKPKKVLCGLEKAALPLSSLGGCSLSALTHSFTPLPKVTDSHPLGAVIMWVWGSHLPSWDLSLCCPWE